MKYEPWIDKLALEEWRRIVTDGPRPFDVFEWGSGNSTLWFGLKRVGKVWSVEHDTTWLDTVIKERNLLQLENVTLLYLPPTSEEGCLHSTALPNLNFQLYVDAIKIPNCKFDFVVVDGRARVMCFKTACQYVKDGGYITLHDAERGNYSDCYSFAEALGLKICDIKEERTTLVCQKPHGIAQS